MPAVSADALGSLHSFRTHLLAANLEARGGIERIKHVLGFRRFSLRGHRKVRGEWQLVCAAFKLKRIAVLTTA